jgi:enamine deaminase RidA (YjgF/YER057c/UK114 family)
MVAEQSIHRSPPTPGRSRPLLDAGGTLCAWVEMKRCDEMSAVTPILPTPVGKAGICHAQGMAAGAWVFATGHMAQAYPGGLDPAVESAGLPHGGLPKNQKEADLIFSRIDAVLRAAGTGLENVVRVDQYYPTHTAVDHYHVVRAKRLPTVPPSTSILIEALPVPGAEMNVQAIAVMPGKDRAPTPLRDAAINAHPTSGYCPALHAGDFVFIAGMTAGAKPGEPARDGLAEAAQVPAGNLWRGTPIKLQAQYIIEQKLLPALELAGSSPKNVCKAQVYLVHAEDCAPFLQIWHRTFGDHPAAVSIIPCSNPGIGQLHARIEINVLALRDAGATCKEVIADDLFTGYAGVPGAVKAGDLLLLSGLMAVDANGLVADAQPDAGQPYLMSSIKAQMRATLSRAKEICARAGTSLENAVRIQHFHTDLNELLPALEVWQEMLPGKPLPFTAVGVPRHMPAPGVSVLLDLWVYAPGGE